MGIRSNITVPAVTASVSVTGRICRPGSEGVGIASSAPTIVITTSVSVGRLSVKSLRFIVSLRIRLAIA